MLLRSRGRSGEDVLEELPQGSSLRVAQTFAEGPLEASQCVDGFGEDLALQSAAELRVVARPVLRRHDQPTGKKRALQGLGDADDEDGAWDPEPCANPRKLLAPEALAVTVDLRFCPVGLEVRVHVGLKHHGLPG